MSGSKLGLRSFFYNPWTSSRSSALSGVSCKTHASDALMWDLWLLWATSFSQSSVQKIHMTKASFKLHHSNVLSTLEFKCHEWMKPLLIHCNGLTHLHKRRWGVGMFALLLHLHLTTWWPGNNMKVNKAERESLNSDENVTELQLLPNLVCSVDNVSFQPWESQIDCNKAV